MPGILSDKVSLITGAGSGIGRASAIAFAREGAQVVVSDVNAEGGEETVSRISEIGGQAIFVAADVSRAAEVAALVQSTVQQYGRLDCALNNAGVSGGQGLIHEYSEDDWDRLRNRHQSKGCLAMPEIRNHPDAGAGRRLHRQYSVNNGLGRGVSFPFLWSVQARCSGVDQERCGTIRPVGN